MSVYFAQAGDYIKVGYSDDPFSRMTTVTRNGTRPDDLPHGADADLIGWIPGDRDREAQLHRQFADRHTAGEWFRLDRDEVADLIWDDPRGDDIRRMSAMAVFACDRHSDMTRDEIEAAGIEILAPPPEEQRRRMNSWLGATTA